MSTAAAAVPSGQGLLFRAEALRFGSRRMVRVLVLLGLLGFLAALVLIYTQHAKPSAAGFAEAAQRRQHIVDQSNRSRADCLASVGTTDGPSTKDDCGTPTTPDDVGRLSDFLAKPPFQLAGEGADGVLVVSAGTSAVAFLIGATFIGAEWSTRSMMGLLFWEPRRQRVMLAKLAVLTCGTGALAVLAEAAWLLAARVLSLTRGISPGPRGVWGQLAGSAGRGAVLVVLMALLGFGIANLVRNSAAALGVGFLYFAVIETLVRAVRTTWQPWLLTDNAVALVTRGGFPVYFTEGFVDSHGQYHDTGREYLVSNLHGGLVLAGLTALVVAAGMFLFGRRDLS